MRRRLAATIAALTATALLWSSPAPTATAKLPPPPKQLTTNTIDAHLGYKPQTTCSPSAKPGTTALLKLLIATWGGSSSGISRGCSVGGTSEHKEGRALDWRRNVKYASHRKKVNQAMKWLTANNGEVAYRLGVMYIIWNQRIWSIYYPELGWRKMANRGSYTANHKDHVHISLSWDGAMKQTSWWTGAPVTKPLNSRCGVSGKPKCLPTIARNAKLKWPYQKTKVPASFLPAPWTTPNIGGSPQVGRTLTAVPGTWVPAGAALTYQWYAGSRQIAGATGATYVVTPADVGKAIKVKVSATTASGTTSKTSDSLADVYRGRFTAPKPTIVGTIAAGQVVGVSLGAWAPQPPTKLAYAWLRNGKKIAGAKSATYRVTAADTGRKLTVKVNGKRSGFYAKTVYSAAVKVGKPFTNAPAPIISGQATVGQTLTAKPGTWQPKPSTLTYQWFADGKLLAGATGSTLELTDVHLGKLVAVQVTAKRSGYATTAVMSAEVTVQAPAELTKSTPAPEESSPSSTPSPETDESATPTPSPGESP